MSGDVARRVLWAERPRCATRHHVATRTPQRLTRAACGHGFGSHDGGVRKGLEAPDGR